jgi:predicted  nucleic acid-binding Zn-ribbon protein
MACMDHVCLGCGRAEMNNKTGPDQWPCPTCGSEEYSSHFDEEPDHDHADETESYSLETQERDNV